MRPLSYKLWHNGLYLLKKVTRKTTERKENHFYISRFKTYESLIFGQMFSTKKADDKEEERAGSNNNKTRNLSLEGDDMERLA